MNKFSKFAFTAISVTLLSSCAINNAINNALDAVDSKINKAFEASPEDLTYSETVKVPGLQKDELFTKIKTWYDGAFKNPEVIRFEKPSSDHKTINISGQKDELFTKPDLFTTINIEYRALTEADKKPELRDYGVNLGSTKHYASNIPGKVELKLNLSGKPVLFTNASQDIIKAKYMVLTNYDYEPASGNASKGGRTDESIAFNAVYMDVEIHVSDEQYQLEITGIDEQVIYSYRDILRGETTWSKWVLRIHQNISFTGLTVVKVARQDIANALRSAVSSASISEE
jgi:hypothetical protein